MSKVCLGFSSAAPVNLLSAAAKGTSKVPGVALPVIKGIVTIRPGFGTRLIVVAICSGGVFLVIHLAKNHFSSQPTEEEETYFVGEDFSGHSPTPSPVDFKRDGYEKNPFICGMKPDTPQKKETPKKPPPQRGTLNPFTTEVSDDYFESPKQPSPPPPHSNQPSNITSGSGWGTTNSAYLEGLLVLQKKEEKGAE